MVWREVEVGLRSEEVEEMRGLSKYHVEEMRGLSRYH